MTPQEKAYQLAVRFREYSYFDYLAHEDDEECWENAKKCALIAVDEVLYALSVPPIQNKGHLLYDGQIDYWQQVKQEIEKL